MPDVTVRSPIAFDNDSIRAVLLNRVAIIVAANLRCRDYNNEPFELTSKQITVHLQPYEDAYVLANGAPITLTIIGYDYPSRMRTIDDRTQKIRDQLIHFYESMGIKADAGIEHLVEVMFVPMKDGCYA